MECKKVRRINKKNAVSNENPDYLASSPHFLLRDPDTNTFFAKRDRHREKNGFPKEHPHQKKQFIQHRLGISKDSPFANKFSVFNSLTKALLEEEDQSKRMSSRIQPNAALRPQAAPPNGHSFLKKALHLNKSTFMKLASNMRPPDQQKLISFYFSSHTRNSLYRTMSRCPS